jgi:L-serine dehydratase
MRAAGVFAAHLAASGRLGEVRRVTCSLYGSLGSTGLGHGTPDAVLAGLAGHAPETCDPGDVRAAWSGLAEGAMLHLAGRHPIPVAAGDVTFEPRTRLPGHPNALTLTAWATDAHPLYDETWYSVGGGFIRRDGDPIGEAAPSARIPYPYSSSSELLAACDRTGGAISDVARANEEALHGRDTLDAGLDAIWAAMHECVTAGLAGEGVLPGGLHVRRRAAGIRRQLEE